MAGVHDGERRILQAIHRFVNRPVRTYGDFT